MSDDIVKRLCNNPRAFTDIEVFEAADEIERLRKLLLEAGNWISVSIPSNGALVARITAAIGGKNND